MARLLSLHFQTQAHSVTKSCPALNDCMDRSPPSSSVHGVPQARVLEGLPFPPPGDLLHRGIEPTSPVSPVVTGGFLTTESPGKPSIFK